MRRPSLHARFVASVVVPVAVVGSLMHFVHRDNLSAQLHEGLDARARSEAYLLSIMILDPLLTGEGFEITRVVSEIVSQSDEVVYAFVVDAAGSILAHSFDGGFPTDLQPIASGPLEQGMDLETESGWIRHVSVPILRGTHGAVHVGVTEDGTREAVEASVLRLDLGFMLFGSLLFCLVSSASQPIAQGVGELVRKVARCSPIPRTGEPELTAEGPPELEALARAFNSLRARLGEEHRRALDAERFAAVSQLAAGLAHEINSPLAGALAAIRGLSSGRVPPGREEAYLRMAEESLERLAAVVSRTSRLATGPEWVEPEPTDLIEVARFAIDRMPRKPPGEEVFIQLESAEGVPAVQGCPIMLEQMLVNVLTNAVEASGPGQTVRLSVEMRDSDAAVVVEDRGRGMDAELVAELGSRPVARKDGGGLGLGLLLTKRGMTLHGGRLEIESRLGAGTRVTLRFPAETVAETGAAS